MYMLCIFIGTLLGSWRSSMIKWSKFCLCALKSMKQKIRASGKRHWKFFDMGTIGTTFLERFSTIMSIN